MTRRVFFTKIVIIIIYIGNRVIITKIAIAISEPGSRQKKLLETTEKKPVKILGCSKGRNHRRGW
jgi:hypothetical protein